MTDGSAIPDAYDGREQALIKHRLLQSYLQKLFLIIGMSAGRGGHIELCYVDCFAGPWGDDSDGMDATSIAVSLRTLDTCRQTLGIKGVSAKIRALYVEKDPCAFARLSAYLQSSTPRGIHAECWNGDFVALRDELLQWAGRDAFVFFFIDPKGWKDVGIETLRKLLQRPRSEFLINFMYDFVNRTMSMPYWQRDMAELLGETISLDGMGPEQREHSILKTYRENLKRCLPAPKPEYQPRSAYVRVLDPTRERPKYHLIYVTSHPRGIVEFMEISEDVDLVQKQVRARKKGVEREQRTGMSDMFGAETLVNPSAGHASPEDVDRFWLNYLKSGIRCIGRKRVRRHPRRYRLVPGRPAILSGTARQRWRGAQPRCRWSATPRSRCTSKPWAASACNLWRHEHEHLQSHRMDRADLESHGGLHQDFSGLQELLRRSNGPPPSGHGSERL